jgi:hypothetical protein
VRAGEFGQVAGPVLHVQSRNGVSRPVGARRRGNMKLPKVARVSKNVKRDGRFHGYVMVLALSVVIGVVTTGSGRALSVLPSGGAIATPTTSGSRLSVPRPTGVVAGDVLIASVDARLSAEASITAPTGWILIRRDSSAPRYGSLSQALYYKVAGSAEPTKYAWFLAAPVSAAGSVVDFKGPRSIIARRFAQRGVHPREQVGNCALRHDSCPGGHRAGLFGLTGGRAVRPPTGMTESSTCIQRAGPRLSASEGAAYIQGARAPQETRLLRSGEARVAARSASS